MDPIVKLNDNVDNLSIKKAVKWLIYLFAIIGFVLVFGYFAVRFGLTNEKGLIDNQENDFFTSKMIATTSPIWAKGEEWTVLENAIIRDRSTIDRAAKDADLDSRLLLAGLVPEQLRLFYSEREIFKQIFAPLQILGNQSQFSWGIMGIKQETAVAIEEHLKDKESPFYLGPKYEHLLDFTSENIGDIGAERFQRLTNEKDHYFNYLYASLYMKQTIKQWADAGFDISHRPEIIGTLFNIGFNNSKPNSDPKSGGSTLNINGKTYSFGTLAAEFYYSDKLR